MTGAALALVLTAAVAHASWNVLAKRAGTGGAPFAWLCSAVESVLWMPVAAVALGITAPALTPTAVAFVLGSAVLHSAYFLLLLRGYASGDMSLVYPVARGLGPLIAVAGAVLLLGERPTPLALLGAAAVGGGVLWAGRADRSAALLDGRGTGRSLLYAVATAAMIAGYSLWDGLAMQTLALSPVLYHWLGTVARLPLLASALRGRGDEVRETWARARGSILGVAVLAPLAYMLVLWAYRMAPVSYVAPAREFSIVVGAVLGVWLLGERGSAARVAAAVTITLGVVLLGVA